MTNGNKIVFRHRPGMLLIETVVTIIIASMAILGFGYFMIEVSEQMRIAWQLRDAEQFAYYYVDQFRDKVRNGTDATITRFTPPCAMTVNYVDPEDPLGKAHLYEFEYDRRAGIPVIRKDGVPMEYPGFPPPSPSGRDEVTVDPSSFMIETYPGVPPSGVDPFWFEEHFAKYYLNLSFTMYYRRYPLIQSRGIFEKEMEFSTGVYETNMNWTVIPTDTTNNSGGGS